MEGDPPVPAVGACLDMPAQRRGAAMFDRRHDLELMQAEMPRVGGPVGRSSIAEVSPTAAVPFNNLFIGGIHPENRNSD